jgi:flagellar hook-associated protein 2
MAALSKTASFKKFSGTSSDEDIFTATVDSSAARGSFAVEVQALAARDKISAGPYASIDTQIGTGTLTLAVGSESFDITVDSSNNTVSGLRDAINSASDNTGVTASLVNTDAGYRLILSSNQTGTSNALTVTVSGDGDGNNTDNSGLSSLAYDVSGGVTNATAITTAKDAVITIDGFTVTNSSNIFADALQGVTFTAKSLGTASLEVQRDDGAIVESVKSFVDAFNALRTEIKTQRAGQLEADSTLLSIERGIVDVLNSGNAISGSAFSYLIQAGISIDKNGVMQVDEDDVISALNSDFNSFVSLFSAEGEGFAARFESLADSWLQNDGLIEAREDGLESQVKRIDNDKIRLEARIDIVEARLRSQYSALDTLVSQLSSTGSFLSQQLASLNSR